jgi:hypothetical protein
MHKHFGVGDLNFFAGKHISQICYNWYVDDKLNHCAHFVSHVLGISETNNCYNARGTPGRTMPGACIRVDELFNDWCQSRGRWHDKPVALHQCLFFISIQAMSPRIRCTSDGTLLNMWAYSLTEWLFEWTKKSGCSTGITDGSPLRGPQTQGLALLRHVRFMTGGSLFRRWQLSCW